MSQWNRTMTPTSHDADEWGNVLVMQDNGMKSVLHWSEVTLEFPQDAWMSLPESDQPQTITITIEAGERAFTIDKVGRRIEVQDSRDPMGQPFMCGEVESLDGLLLVVETILEDHIVGGEQDTNQKDLDGIVTDYLNSLRGKKTCHCC